MADKDKEAHVERESDAQSDMIQNSCLSDILKAITGLGSRMDNLQDQLNSMSQCDPAVPEQSEDSVVGDHNEEAGGVSYDCAGQHRLVTLSPVANSLAGVLPTLTTTKLIRSVICLWRCHKRE